MAVLISFDSFEQKLSLTDLTNLCNKKNWEDVNETLLSKNWTFFDSEKGSSIKYNTITWSFNKDYYGDEAEGWFYLYTYDGLPNKISFSVFNKKSYSIIQNSVATAGFKLVNSEIGDDEVISTYENTNYSLKILTEKRSDDEWDNTSITAYNITLVKKAGIYDENNGKKTDYYYDDVVKAEYILSNGKFNGPFKYYHENGQIKRIGSYLNDDEHGNFVEYDDEGNKVVEYFVSKGLKNDVLKFYENGKLSFSNTFVNDIKNGQHIEYYYSEETGLMNFKLIGNYLNDEKNGNWKLYYTGDTKERLVTFENYSYGILNGLFKDIQGDSIIVGSYKNNKLHGDYKVYHDLSNMLLGSIMNTDTSALTLISKGSYFEDEKSGLWRNYDLTSSLRSEGEFSNGKETGEWKYYYSDWSDEEDGNMPYSKELYLIQNYINGKLEGKSTRYSSLEKEEYPCSEFDQSKSSLDTCSRYIYEKFLETSFYKQGKLNGPYEFLDSNNEVVAKGFLKDDLKDGEWLYRYSEIDINDELYFIYKKGIYTKDNKDGKWIQYNANGKIEVTSNYKNGDLHGEWIFWNQFNKPREKKEFNYGKLLKLNVYDSLGANTVNEYEIYDDNLSSYKCRKTEYLEDGYTRQEYFVNKEKEIDHNWFEFMFELAIDKGVSDGAAAYKDGMFTLFSYKNKPIVSGQYYKEERIGLWTFYYYEKNVKMELHFLKNKRFDEKYFNLNNELYSGTFTYYDEGNGIKELRKIKDGLRDGKTSYFDIKTGHLIKKESYKNGELK